MKPERPARRRFGLPFRESSYRSEVDDELAFHVEMRVQALVAQGLSPQEAQRVALQKFGDVRAVRSRMIREGRREAVISVGIEGLRNTFGDLRMAVRSLVRTPTLTLSALVILAIGIGATSSVFAVVQAVVLEPMPFAHPERTVQIEISEGVAGSPSGLVSPGVLLEWQAGATAIEAVAGVARTTAALRTDDLTVRVEGVAVSHTYWDVTGVVPMLGRVFDAREDEPGASAVVVLSHGLWERGFGAAPSALGRTIDLDGVPTSVVGVMPPDLDALEGPAEFWRPLRLDPAQRGNVGSRYLGAMALVREGASVGEAQQGLDQVLDVLGVRSEDGNAFHAILTPTEELLSRPLRPVLFVTLAAMGLVLLVGCGNVATLLIARGASREHELAIRAALGAGRPRLVRGLLAEGVVLAGLSSLLGLVLAGWGVGALKAWTPFPVPRLDQAYLDATVVLFAIGLAAGTAIIFGLAPALRGARVDVAGALVGGEGATARIAGGRDRLRSGFLALQVGLSLTLLIGAGLLVRTSIELNDVPNGYEADGVLSALVALPFARYPDLASVLERYDEIHAAMLSLPDVEAAAVGSRVPLTGGGAGYGFLSDGGDGQGRVQTRLRITGAGYFTTLGVPIVAGRELLAADDASALPAVVVNESFARALGVPGPEAVGRFVYAEGGGPFSDETGAPIRWEIVGVSQDSRDLGPRRPARPELFFSLAQAPSEPWDWLGRQMVLTLRTARDPLDLVVPLQRAIRSVDPELPLYDVRSLTDRLDDELARERFGALMVSGLGLVGLLLAATGIAGSVTYRVRSRTREIGVRVALGAGRGGVRRMIVAQSMVPVAIGVALGLPVALSAARGLEGVLFGVGPGDPWVAVGAVAALLGIAVLAALIPARRVTLIDPVDALRSH